MFVLSSMSHRLMMCSIAALIPIGGAGAATYLVKPDGTGDFPTIQQAVDATVEGDVVELDDGTFTGAGNVSIRIYDHPITLRSRSGDRDACVIDGRDESDVWGVSFFGASDGAAIESITVTRAADDGIKSTSDVTIRDCVVMDTSDHGISITYAGGQVLGCLVTRCYSAFGGGGGIYVREGSPLIADCSIIDNSSNAASGGIRIQDANPTVRDTEIIGNVGGVGGGVLAEGGTLLRCTIRENEGIIRGGGASLHAGSVMSDCLVEENIARDGAGVVLEEGARLESSIIHGNVAQETGGGVWIFIWPGPGLAGVIDGCTVTNNDAIHGGGVYVRNDPGSAADVVILSSTIASNGAKTGGGIFVESGGAVIGRAIVWGNCAAAQSDDLFLAEAVTHVTCSAIPPVDYYGPGDATFDAAWTGGDPQFCDPTPCGTTPPSWGDFGLHTSSPCAAENSPCEARIGAEDVACEATPARAVSWGRLKDRFSAR